jgi:hypothetical protein
MTDVTVVQPGRGLNVIFLHQLPAKRFLVDGRLIAHRENLILWADILLGMPVTVHTPLHIERIGFPGQRHLVHTPMTGLTTHSLGDVDAVVEVHKVRHIVHPDPLDGLARTEAFPDWFEHGALVPDLAVTGHTGFGGGNIGEGRLIHRHMTVTAVYAIVYDMMLVAERDRLLNGIINPDGKGRAKERRQRYTTTKNQKHTSGDGDPGESIHAWMKDLRPVFPTRHPKPQFETFAFLERPRKTSTSRRAGTAMNKTFSPVCQTIGFGDFLHSAC